jgi:acyl-CoA synthetase (AMP-forming)/AMP-acid ligase II
MKLFCDSRFSDDQNAYDYKHIIEAVNTHGIRLGSALRPGAKCGILCDRGLNTAVAILSCWCANMVPIPMSKSYGEKHCNAIIHLTSPDIIITDNIGACAFRYVYNMNTNNFVGETPLILIENELDDIALIMCTSGTTGTPKGAMITINGLKKNILAIADYFAITKDDAIMIARPLYHCAVLTGEFLVSLYNGLEIIFFDQSYSPARFVSYASQKKATVVCGTPTLFNHIAQFVKRHPQINSIKTIALSGECLIKEIANNIRNAFPDTNIYNVYGLTEAAPRVAYLPPEYYDEYPESVGFSLNLTEIKVIDIESGKEQPTGTSGLLMIRSPSVMKGYYKNKAKTDETIVNGWLNTRDMGYKDDNGFLYILSRTDDMIIKAGMNIYPKEIENPVNTLPEIYECMVYGVRCKNGEIIVLDVVLRDGFSEVDIKTLMIRFQTILPNYLLPAKINIVKSLPRNASGKIMRRRE